MNKQDLVHTRTASALEQKLGTRKKFSEVLGQLDDAQDDIKLLKAYLDDKLENVYSEISRTATEINQKVEDLDTNVKAELELKVGVDENDKVVSMINASAEVIRLASNRLVVDSDNFSVTEEGEIDAQSGKIGNLIVMGSRLVVTPGIHGTWQVNYSSGSSSTYYGYLFFAISPTGFRAEIYPDMSEDGRPVGDFTIASIALHTGSSITPA